MAASEHIVQIPNPCKQDWQQMTPDGNGRFCTHCAKSVIDFTTLTDAQIVALLSQNKGSLCGRFENTQLNRILTDRQLKARSGNRFKEIFAALLLLVTTKEITASKPPIEKISITQSDKTQLAEFEDNKDTVTTTPSTLAGTVVDSLSKIPIQGATIQNLSSHNVFVSDEHGNFKISATIGDSIMINYFGYQSESFVVRNFDPHIYTLSERTDVFITAGVMVSYEPTLKSKVKHVLGIRPKAPKH